MICASSKKNLNWRWTQILMKNASVFRILALIAVLLGASANAGAAELRIIRQHTTYRRAWAQDCFLMPDVIVAVDALGPYCSSPRGHYHWIVRHW